MKITMKIRENTMSNETWWAAIRNADDYWHKVKDNQFSRFGKDSLSVEFGSQVDSERSLPEVAAKQMDLFELEGGI